ncbi:acetyltransferase (GNAT) family protein [Fibrobacter sp. UWR4]|nr:acetyltransferase (GNAT) family protein [Fibrobacter sp. UWR4]PZW65508.1 acetyltransferase (GNAT) family protein [Fibrobacter sp. UWR1]
MFFYFKDMYEILPYTKELDSRLDRFVNQDSVNGTFLQSRRFLNYHPEGRFDEAGFALQKSGIIAAYFPGVKIVGNVNEKPAFISHAGSTFGGPIMGKPFYNGAKIQEVLSEADAYLSQNFSEVRLKVTPALFSEESPDLLEYILEHLGYQRHTELSCSTPIKKGEDPLERCDAKHRHQFAASENYKLTYRDLESEEDFATFYKFLEISKAKHQTKPVHSLAELLDLKKRIKKSIRFKSLWLDNRYICGMMQFLFPKTGVVHDQYISADESFDLFHHTTAMHVYAMREAAEEGYTNFSWGISTEEHGDILNENLYRFKEAFGAKPCVNVTFTKKF